MPTDLRLTLGLAIIALLWVAMPARVAADGITSSVVVTTDYLHRGISQTDAEPALQASTVYWHATGWYAGLWASNVSTARRYLATDTSNLEVNGFLGLTRRITPDWVVDIQAVQYVYPDDPSPVDYEYVELSGNIAYRERIYASVLASPNSTFFTRRGGAVRETTFAYEFSVQQGLFSWLKVAAGAGYQDLPEQLSGYWYGSGSVALHLHRVMLELGYYAVDHRGEALFGTDLAGGRTVLTATMTF